MKHSIYLLIAAASLMFAACEREMAPKDDAPEAKATFTAYVENAPELKAVLGLNESNKPQTFWENGDEIAVFTSADGASQSGKIGYKFTASLSANATAADFSYSGEDTFGVGEYMAIYPYTSNKRGVNFTAYRVAGTVLPATQTLVAGSFDRAAAISIAYGTNGATSLAFKNATALLKFRVSDATVTDGRIEVNSADAISGTFRATVDVENDNVALEKYTASGVSQNNYVNFSIDGTTALATGTDYYVAVSPCTLTDGLKVILNGSVVKTISSTDLPALQRNKIYNLGTLTLPQKETKTLNFDFSGTPLTGWPTTDNWQDGPGNLTCVYPLDGVDYNFILTDCGNASKARVSWTQDKGGLVLWATWRYVGLPALEGYKLIQVTGSLCLANNSKRKAGIAKSVVADNTAGQNEFVSGGDPIGWTTNGAVYSYNLENTEANTVYYLTCTNTSIGTSYLKLVYEKVD